MKYKGSCTANTPNNNNNKGPPFKVPKLKETLWTFWGKKKEERKSKIKCASLEYLNQNDD